MQLKTLTLNGTTYDSFAVSEADKQEIAELAAEMVDVPVGGGGTGGLDRLIAKYVHTSNKVIRPTALDLATGVFTCAGHGLTTGNEAIVINDDQYRYIPFELLSTYMSSVGSLSVRVIDTDTFVLRNGSTDITYPNEANTMIDVSKWHIEIPNKETLVIGGFSAESVEVRVCGFYWGTNNYQFAINPYSNGVEVACLFDTNLHKTLPFSNSSLLCPFVSGRYYIGLEYEYDLAHLTPSSKLDDYTYLQKYPQYMAFSSRSNGKTGRATFPLKAHNNITDLKVCMLLANHGIRLANGFTVEVYRRG